MNMILDSLSVALDNKVLCLLQPNRHVNVRKFEERKWESSWKILMSLCTFAVHSWMLCGCSQKGCSESRKSTKTFDHVLLTTVCTLTAPMWGSFPTLFTSLDCRIHSLGSVKCSRAGQLQLAQVTPEFRAVCGGGRPWQSLWEQLWEHTASSESGP